MSKEKPELKNGDQTYRVNSDNFGMSEDKVYGDFYSDACKDADDDDEIPF
ncbi:hypothetical protein [Terrisporobacter hibernicus]|uniref:Single-stranded DNA-binding protein n=1 Tax=Terrisporobacter hibernicus TaxID=2813371 RepID=A0AAX2ZJ63_9FIRM|nr:hypothetical protein [Terrisporobacter hibernicus]UEL47722.1 hypothetical protein JW646_19240 [Terrisporobacter hibernicus]